MRRLAVRLLALVVIMLFVFIPFVAGLGAWAVMLVIVLPVCLLAFAIVRRLAVTLLGNVDIVLEMIAII